MSYQDCESDYGRRISLHKDGVGGSLTDLLNGINYKIEALHGSTRSRNKKIQKSMVNFGVPTNLENLICEYSELPPNPSIIEIIDQLKLEKENCKAEPLHSLLNRRQKLQEKIDSFNYKIAVLNVDKRELEKEQRLRDNMQNEIEYPETRFGMRMREFI